MATRQNEGRLAGPHQVVHKPAGTTLRVVAGAMMAGIAAWGGGVDLIATASAQTQASRRPPATGLLDTLMQGPRLRTDPGEPSDWVKSARPAEPPQPVRGAQGEPARPLMNAAAIRKREAELDGLRARHDRIAGRKPSKAKYASAAGEPVNKPKKPEIRCVVTCEQTIGRPPKR